MRMSWIAAALALGHGTGEEVRVRLTWGHASAAGTPFSVRVAPQGGGVTVTKGEGHLLEAGEGEKEGSWRTRAGGGDVDGIEFALDWPRDAKRQTRKLHGIWSALLAQSDEDTVRRLRSDPAFRADSPLFMVQLDPEGTKGFAVGVEQLVQERAMWVPAYDVYLTAGDSPVPFEDHRKALQAWKGKRILDRVREDPEEGYEEYAARWADMGDPKYPHPSHVVGITWDSAISKFGIDRRGGVSGDLGNPDKFSLSFRLDGWTWKGQRLEDGLPVLTTVHEKEGVRLTIEEFAWPLDGPPRGRRGDIAMALLGRATLTELEGKPRKMSLGIVHQREFPPGAEVKAAVRASVLEESVSGRVLLALEGGALDLVGDAADGKVEKGKPARRKMEVSLDLDLPANGSRPVVLRLPSPTLEAKDESRLLKIDPAAAREATLKFWTDWLARGAQFRVPDKAVNDLFRANLWHALRLPRRHGGTGEDVKIDLPYSNFAYDQKGTPWPVNQAVYVDYMLYDLRGHHDVSVEELLAMYRNNQGADGRVGGYAQWGVYTPGMLYSVSKNFLLSRDRRALEKLLSPTIKAMDWCLAQMRDARERGELVRLPLNDLTGEGVWAFNQAYFFAGLDLWGRVLGEIGHPRAEECRAAAREMKKAVERGFGRAAMLSPLVQLRDHTWVPYVPCEARTPRRLLEQWYPTDVDTGAVHLLRLKALDPKGPLADFLLHDHEDNLFLKGWGMANEPVYNQQATAYLLRDDPKAAVRAFYSMAACAFSHSTLEPVEHRWAWGQYFGPPSTDGAWFELFRHMLIHELDDGTLLLGQAAPRAWLEDGKKVEVERAPTYYGRLTFAIESEAKAGKIRATVRMPSEGKPKALLVRLRHPQGAPVRSVQVNGAEWKDFDAVREWVRIETPSAGKVYAISASY